MPARKLNGHLCGRLARDLKKGHTLRLVAAKNSVTRQSLFNWIKTGKEQIENEEPTDFQEWCVKLHIAYETRTETVVEGQFEVLTTNVDPKIALQILDRYAPPEPDDEEDTPKPNAGEGTLSDESIKDISEIFGICDPETLDP